MGASVAGTAQAQCASVTLATHLAVGPSPWSPKKAPQSLGVDHISHAGPGPCVVGWEKLSLQSPLSATAWFELRPEPSVRRLQTGQAS